MSTISPPPPPAPPPPMDHDPRQIARLAELHEGSARAHLIRVEEEASVEAKRAPALRSRPAVWSQHQMLAASGFAIAGSLWSLIEPPRAVTSYRVGGTLYRIMGHSYWMVLAMAAANREDLASMAPWVGEERSPTPQMIAFAMMSNALSETDNQGRYDEWLTTQWQHAGNVPVGRLGIPLDAYGHCAQAIREARDRRQNRERFFARAGSYIRRAAEVIRAASHDRFHWQQLQSSILPAEPEAVAATVALSTASHRYLDASLVELPDLDEHGRRLLQVGEAMRTMEREPPPRQRRRG